MHRATDLAMRPGAGKLLIAEPFMQDPNFKRSVVLLCQHGPDEGAFGLILNQPLPVKLKDILDLDAISDAFRLNRGGPVENSHLFFLHRVPHLIPGGIEVRDNIRLGGHFKEVQELLIHQKITPQDIRFFVGYSGWGPGQLENELRIKSWIIETASEADIFTTRLSEDRYWRHVLQRKGKTFGYIATFPESPIQN